MKILMVSGDRRLLDPASEAGKRLALQRAQVERLDLFIWPQVHSVFSIYRAALATRYDVVTAQDPFWRGLVGWKCAWLSGARLNIQVHTDLAHESAFRRTIARFVLRRADSIRVVSEAGKRAVEALGAKAPITILPIYIDLAPFKDLPRKAHEGKIILWVGRFTEEKNPFLAVEILRAARAKGLDVSLTMLGAGPLEKALRVRAKGLPVEFPGWRPPQEYLPSADLVLSTSRFESYGISIIEALAAGVAVVAPDVGVAKEAGAVIAPPGELGATALEALRAGGRGSLKLAPLPDAAEWARHWRESLESAVVLKSRA
jgi:glycosyltransferase involved in cell wall biosynthesis